MFLYECFGNENAIKFTRIQCCTQCSQITIDFVIMKANRNYSNYVPYSKTVFSPTNASKFNSHRDVDSVEG